MLHLEAGLCGKTSPRESSVTLAQKQVCRVLSGGRHHQVPRTELRSDQKGIQRRSQT